MVALLRRSKAYIRKISHCFIDAILLYPLVSIGGEGVVYHNIPKGEPKPELNHIRVAGITIDPMNKQNVALNQWVVGWTGPGEWMSYKVIYILYAGVLLQYLLQCCSRYFHV
jgi:hypothetical protein